jgi:peptidoglycan/xylan/chitin deacetylase (PgdA/CDA1 family)
MTHPILPSLTAEQQREEIGSSKAFLEELLGKPVSGFAYPHGKFTDETQAIVQGMGFMYACSSNQELVWQSQQRYALPRFWPKDWSGDQFYKKIKFWLGS